MYIIKVFSLRHSVPQFGKQQRMFIDSMSLGESLIQFGKITLNLNLDARIACMWEDDPAIAWRR